MFNSNDIVIILYRLIKSVIKPIYKLNYKVIVSRIDHKTMEAKLFIHIIKTDEGNYEIAGISEDKVIWFSLPAEFRNIQNHQVLLSKATIKNAVSAIRPVNGYRKVGVKIDENLRKVYFDEDDNLCYNNIPLEESNSMIDYNLDLNKSNQNIFFIQKINELEAKLNSNEIKLQEVEKKFILEKFDKKQNCMKWLERYESECVRHNVTSITKMIEILRFFVDGPAKDWYETNFKKIGLVNWSAWRNSFLTVFIDKGWSKVRKAHSFKYLGGSLVDYALAKERLCLEVESESTVLSRINMIAVGLPLAVQDELDREETTTIEKLCKLY